MYLAVELGTIDLNPVFKGALATILYFLVGTAVLVLGFFVVDILTPGKLRQPRSGSAPTRPPSSQERH